MFEKASRLKVRYETPRGLLTVEDLWDLPLVSNNGISLDKIAVGLSRQLKEETTESFVAVAKKSTEVLQLKFDIAKHIIDTRLAEAATRKQKEEAAAKKERIMEIIARKQDKALEDSSMEELQKMVESL